MWDATDQAFYPAMQGPDGTMMRNPQASYTPAPGEMLWLTIGGSIHIEYKGEPVGWKQKTVTDFGQNTWTPTFDPNGDLPFTLALDSDYYINNQGGNFVVRRTGTGVYSVQMELQTAANPNNTAAFPDATVTFAPQGVTGPNPAEFSTYRFVSDPAQNTFLKLVYKTIGPRDQRAVPAPQAGDIVTDGQYSLVAFDAQGQPIPVQYNWDYPRTGETMGIQTFLYTDGAAGRDYHLLSDPIQLLPADLAVNGQTRTLSLQFDGWLHGLPEYFDEMARNNYTITDALDLGDPAVIPAYVESGMGAESDVTAVKYSEGVKVQ